MSPRELMLGSYRAALAAADPLKIVPAHLPQPPAGRTLVIGAGKAAASMALAVEQNWPAGTPLSGLVITRYQHGLLTNRITVVEAGHPVPDESGEKAAEEILRLVKSLTPADRLLALISGGGSALLSLPAEGIGMADLKATTRELLRSGAPIQDMNVVRKHLSAIQGGRLAAACRAPVTALVISDVTGDAPTHVASGPCAPDPSTFQDALEVLKRYGVQAPRPVVDRLAAGAKGAIPETPKPGSKVFRKVENRVIASAQVLVQLPDPQRPEGGQDQVTGQPWCGRTGDRAGGDRPVSGAANPPQRGQGGDEPCGHLPPGRGCRTAQDGQRQSGQRTDGHQCAATGGASALLTQTQQAVRFPVADGDHGPQSGATR